MLEGLACIDSAPLMNADDYAELLGGAKRSPSASRDAYYEAAQAYLASRYICRNSAQDLVPTLTRLRRRCSPSSVPFAAATTKC